MTVLTRLSRTWLAPAAAVCYFVLWVVGEWARSGLGGPTTVFALLALAIALSTWMPLLSLALIVAVPALQAAGLAVAPSNTTWAAYLAAAIVAFFVGFRGSKAARFLALPAGAAAAVLMALALIAPLSPNPLDQGSGASLRSVAVLVALAAFGIIAAAWGVGMALREFLSRREVSVELHESEIRYERADLELRLAQDRARIARDVHDALAHSLAIIVSQAQGAVALADVRPGALTESVEAIADVGREALLEVRGLVERIQNDDEAVVPRETIADLAALVSHMRTVGMDAVLEIQGSGQLTPSHELAVFRIVQESLTNALKYGGRGVAVRVELVWQENDVRVTVSSVSRTLANPSAVAMGAGVGIHGMKERARLAGGWLTTAQSAENEFVVSASIPAQVRTPVTSGAGQEA
ncbi:sensor histidine kinase [Diaminobutyricibacter sp. McL0618]|uniref:sensor histidine kinase n=1 Tax=Leifsonia sp. McL0618 TaxID=3415677 RepID=UPI003CF20F0E